MTLFLLFWLAMFGFMVGLVFVDKTLYEWKEENKEYFWRMRINYVALLDWVRRLFLLCSFLFVLAGAIAAILFVPKFIP